MPGYHCLKSLDQIPVDYVVKQVKGVIRGYGHNCVEVGSKRIISVYRVYQTEIYGAIEVLFGDPYDVVGRSGGHRLGIEAVCIDQRVGHFYADRVDVDGQYLGLREHERKSDGAPTVRVPYDEDAPWRNEVPEMLKEHDLLQRQTPNAYDLFLLQESGEWRISKAKEVVRRMASERFISCSAIYTVEGR